MGRKNYKNGPTFDEPALRTCPFATRSVWKHQKSKNSEGGCPLFLPEDPPPWNSEPFPFADPFDVGYFYAEIAAISKSKLLWFENRWRTYYPHQEIVQDQDKPVGYLARRRYSFPYKPLRERHGPPMKLRKVRRRLLRARRVSWPVLRVV